MSKWMERAYVGLLLGLLAVVVLMLLVTAINT